MEELTALLNRLEIIGSSNEELYDTDVKEHMYEAVVEIFINENPEYEVPIYFGMFSESSNKEIHDAFKIFQFSTKRKNIDYQKKLALLGPKGIRTNNDQIPECFFGDISVKSLTFSSVNTPFAWLQYDWVYYLFLFSPGLALFSISAVYGPRDINIGWYILLFFVFILISTVLGDKLYQFFADKTYRKNNDS